MWGDGGALEEGEGGLEEEEDKEGGEKEGGGGSGGDGDAEQASGVEDGGEFEGGGAEHKHVVFGREHLLIIYFY